MHFYIVISLPAECSKQNTWQTPTCPEWSSVSHIRRQPSGPCDSTALGTSPLVASARPHHIQAVPVKMYNAMNGSAPSYLQELCVPIYSVTMRVTVHSAAHGDLVVPQTRRLLGTRTFCVAGPAAWNGLPTDIRTASTLANFRQHLKTYLFIRSYYASQSTSSWLCMAPL